MKFFKHNWEQKTQRVSRTEREKRQEKFYKNKLDRFLNSLRVL